MENLRDEEVVDTFSQRYRQYQMKISQADHIKSISKKIAKELLQLERRIMAFENLLSLIRQQRELHGKRQEILRQKFSSLPRLKGNFLIIEKRQEQLALESQKSIIERTVIADYKRSLDSQLQFMQIETEDTFKEKEKYKKEMDKRNIKTGGILEELVNDNVWNRIPHHDEEKWLLPSKFDYSEIEKLLVNKPHGTFLIRTKENNGYILYITCNGEIHQCDIQRNNKNLYGFEMCFCAFETLTELVLTYRVMSLAMHNNYADVHLTFPIFADAEAQSVIEECQVSRM